MGKYRVKWMTLISTHDLIIEASNFYECNLILRTLAEYHSYMTENSINVRAAGGYIQFQHPKYGWMPIDDIDDGLDDNLYGEAYLSQG